MKKLIATCLLSMLHLTAAKYSYSQQPKYQVSIVLKMPGNIGDPIHLCNGVIIQEKMILTTADCLYFKFGPNTNSTKLDASVISVYAGSSNAQTQTLQMNVSSVKIPANFNLTTLENDLALLVLSHPLPLGTRNDINWIMLDDNSHMNRSCLVNFFSRNKKDAIPDYYQTEEFNMLSNDDCRNLTKYPTARKQDICAQYIPPQRFNCEKLDEFLALNNDRGTGVVCKSYLVGLLSSIVSVPYPVNNCSNKILKAFYTYINPHLMWIYTIMSTMETEYISTPYNASLNPLVANPNSLENYPGFENSTKISNSTALQNNSTLSNFPSTNVTITPYNSTIFNSTIFKSSFVNSTAVNYATPHPILINSTRWNTTSSSKNHTSKPETNLVSEHGISATGQHIKHPIKKSSGVRVRLGVKNFLVGLLMSLSWLACYL